MNYLHNLCLLQSSSSKNLILMYPRYFFVGDTKCKSGASFFLTMSQCYHFKVHWLYSSCDVVDDVQICSGPLVHSVNSDSINHRRRFPFNDRTCNTAFAISVIKQLLYCCLFHRLYRHYLATPCRVVPCCFVQGSIVQLF